MSETSWAHIESGRDDRKLQERRIFGPVSQKLLTAQSRRAVSGLEDIRPRSPASTTLVHSMALSMPCRLLRAQIQCPTTFSRSLPRRPHRTLTQIILTAHRRKYATHNQSQFDSTPGGPSSLSASLDTKDRVGGRGSNDTVGPFQLGLSQASLRKQEKVPKWSELSTGGKGAFLSSAHFWSTSSGNCVNDI